MAGQDIQPQKKLTLGFYKATGDYGSPMWYALGKGLVRLGHTVRAWKPTEQYDYTLVFSCVQHVEHFEYKDLSEVRDPFILIDTTEYGWWTHNDFWAHEFYSLFAPGEYDKTPFQAPLLEFLRGRSYPYFRREFYKCVNYPESYYPIDYPLFTENLSYMRVPDMDEYLNRPLDLVMRWGESHPSRGYLEAMLRPLGLKMVLSTGTDKKVPQEQYWEELNCSRSTVSYDGYGSGGFREHEGMLRCLLFRGNLAIEQASPPEPYVHFVPFDVHEELDQLNKPVFKSTDLADVAMEWLSDPVGCWEVYCAGVDHVLRHRVSTAVGRYILEIAEEHDWTRETETEVAFV